MPKPKPTDRKDFNRDGQRIGIVCRACGCSHFSVIYVKQTIAGVVRQKQCRNCGKRVMTRESVS